MTQLVRFGSYAHQLFRAIQPYSTTNMERGTRIHGSWEIKVHANTQKPTAQLSLPTRNIFQIRCSETHLDCWERWLMSNLGFRLIRTQCAWWQRLEAPGVSNWRLQQHRRPWSWPGRTLSLLSGSESRRILPGIFRLSNFRRKIQSLSLLPLSYLWSPLLGFASSRNSESRRILSSAVLVHFLFTLSNSRWKIQNLGREP